MGKKTPEERIKEIAKEVTEVAQPYIKDIKSKAEPVMDDMISKAGPMVDDVRNMAKPYIEDIREKAEPVIDKVIERTAPATKMATDACKTAMDSISLQAARANYKEDIFVQYNDHEIRTTDIAEKAKLDYINRGNKASDIKEIQIYIKPSDNAAYYVVNHSETGRIEF